MREREMGERDGGERGEREREREKGREGGRGGRYQRPLGLLSREYGMKERPSSTPYLLLDLSSVFCLLECQLAKS